jgi:hypothetical protein
MRACGVFAGQREVVQHQRRDDRGALIEHAAHDGGVIGPIAMGVTSESLIYI